MINNSTQKSNTTTPWRSIGVWMAIILIVYQLFNFIRALLNPIEFASSFGVSLDADSNNAYIIVYAIRTLFIGLFGLALVVNRKWDILTLYALIAVVIPLGDALIVALNGGASGTIVRHVLTALFVLATWFMLQRWVKQFSTTS
ncbi:MAG: DUF4267 domain-containing protein [bacterium]|nr:DUF4267 domain-containing protein [bacterium]